MNRQTIILIVGLIVALLAGMFIYAYLKQAEYDRQARETPAETDTDGFTISRIDAKHYYTMPQGIHTIAGEVMVPTACDLLTTHVALLEDKMRVIISFDIINNADNCEPAMTPQRFKVGFEAPQNARIEAMYKGKQIELNLVPASEGETPAEFELFIKG